MMGKQKSSTCVFTTDKSWVKRLQRLDTAVANSPTESLNVWLIKFVEEQIFKFKNFVQELFTGCVVLKEH